VSGRVDKLLLAPQSFDLLKAIALLDQEASQMGFSPLDSRDSQPGLETRGRQTVRLSGQSSLGFVPSDVSAVRSSPETGEAFKLLTAVMSLAGNTGPLPLAFTEELIARNANQDFATRDFLDLFHHRLLRLFYLIRKRSHPGLSIQDPWRSAVPRLVSHLANLPPGRSDRIEDSPATYPRHSSLLAMESRSVVGLRQYLFDRLGIRFQIESFVGRWQFLKGGFVNRLGSSTSEPTSARGHQTILGRNAILGQRVMVPTHGIRLTAGPMPSKIIKDLLPGTPHHNKLKSCLIQYLPSPTCVEVSLSPLRVSIPRPILAAKANLRLGQTAWLVSKVKQTAHPSASRFEIETTDQCSEFVAHEVSA
jgi:type VI secretion system protein ImpH